MKLKPSDVKLEARWFHFNDSWTLNVVYVPSRRCYLVVLHDEDRDYIGWHDIPGSCMKIPFVCRNWRQVKFAVTEHAKQHGGLYEFSATV